MLILTLSVPLVLLALLVGVAAGCTIAFTFQLLRYLRRQHGKKAATTLAYDVLPACEFRRLQRHGYVEVCGASGDRYRIRRGKSVEVIGKFCLCVGPLGKDSYPEDDLVVLYYLYITGDEKLFRMIANPIGRSCFG